MHEPHHHQTWPVLPTVVLTVLHIQTRDERGHEAGHGHWRHKGAVAVVGTQGQSALAQVSQALCQPHHEEVVGVLGMVHCQLAQHGCQPCIVGTCHTCPAVLFMSAFSYNWVSEALHLSAQMRAIIVYLKAEALRLFVEWRCSLWF